MFMPWPRGISTFTAGKSKAAFPRDPKITTEKVQGPWKQTYRAGTTRYQKTLSRNGSLKARSFLMKPRCPEHGPRVQFGGLRAVGKGEPLQLCCMLWEG